ncbi:hypothetical protein BpHYR1_045129 [Brachionus plicatilis]|uniref:Uncharacterized protein n=1 Tax=Brachionus plicatilis TaxID=10195 RepID=A0A3M7PIT6_BRAPC|nr:hypothetical protein BpHYR1_045129 [Brachionus plicatilis]
MTINHLVLFTNFSESKTLVKLRFSEINISTKKKGCFFFAFLMGAVFTGYPLRRNSSKYAKS